MFHEVDTTVFTEQYDWSANVLPEIFTGKL
jgi:hypothetical protein